MLRALTRVWARLKSLRGMPLPAAELRAAVGQDAPYLLVAATTRDAPIAPAEVAVPWPTTLTRRAPPTLADLTCAHICGMKVAQHFRLPRTFDPSDANQRFVHVYAHLRTEQQRAKLAQLH